MNSQKSWFSRIFSSEHRGSARHPATGLIAYYWQGTGSEAHPIQNISSTGFYVATKERWLPGTILTMTLQKAAVAGSSPELYIAVQTKVVRLDKDGVGFSFLQLEPQPVRQQDAFSNKPAGRKALERFLDQLLSEQGHVTLGATEPEYLLKVRARRISSGGNAMKRFREENGQALVITVLSMTCLLGFVALAADVGMMFHVKRVAQTAADGAAIAGAAGMSTGTTGAAAQAAAIQNGITDGVNGATVTVNGPPNGPSTGPHAGDPNYVEVIVAQKQPTIFMRMFNQNSMTVRARAVAGYGTTNLCVLTTGQTGNDISIIGNTTISVTTCGVVDDSSSPSSAGKNAALYLQGNAQLDAQSIGVAGGYAVTGGAGFTQATPSTGMVPVSDPLAATMAANPINVPATCSPAPTFTSGNTLSITAGCYNGISVGNNQTLNLGSGVYVINGPLALSGGATVNGTGVTLALESTTSMGGNTVLNLSAPLSGTYSGLLIYQPASNTNPITLIGTPGAPLQGIVYAPSAPVTVQGNSGATVSLDLVVNTLSLIGNATFTDYAQLNSSDILKTVRLVE